MHNMRKIAITLLALCLTAIAVAPAGAASLLAETFSYPDGNLVPNGGWTTFSGSTDITLVSGVANGASSKSADDSRGFAAQSTTAKTYWCMNLNVPSSQTASTVHVAFAFLMDAGTTNFEGRLYLVPAPGTGKFQLGISPGSCNSPCFPALWPGTLNMDQSYVVTVSYDASNASSELWVDPSSESDVKVSTTVFSGTAPLNTAVEKFGLRQGAAPTGYSGSNNWVWQVDNIGVGTTFNDACASAPVPTNRGTWGLLKTLYRN
jgi:hypothetical protein